MFYNVKMLQFCGVSEVNPSKKERLLTSTANKPVFYRHNEHLQKKAFIPLLPSPHTNTASLTAGVNTGPSTDQ